MGTNVHDIFLLDCDTYSDYLDTFVTRNDVRFLRNMRFCHMLVELGYRSASDIYTPEQFEKRKAAVLEALYPAKKASCTFSEGIEITDPVLLELALRERLNQQKIISTIIFLKHRLKSGFEVSGYIDYEHSLRRAASGADNSRNWSSIFQQKALLRPRSTDLSYFDWHKGIVHYSNSENYVVVHDVAYGLIFMHSGDHKKICVDVTREIYSGNCVRTMYFSEIYGHVIFYDHVVRKKI